MENEIFFISRIYKQDKKKNLKAIKNEILQLTFTVISIYIDFLIVFTLNMKLN